MVRHSIESDRMDSNYTLKTMKHPSIVMVWRCFNFFGRDSLYFLPNNNIMNGVRYLDKIAKKFPITMEIHQTSIHFYT